MDEVYGEDGLAVVQHDEPAGELYADGGLAVVQHDDFPVDNLYYGDGGIAVVQHEEQPQASALGMTDELDQLLGLGAQAWQPQQQQPGYGGEEEDEDEDEDEEDAEEQEEEDEEEEQGPLGPEQQEALMNKMKFDAMSEAQRNRYEEYRRATLPRAKLKKLLEELAGQKVDGRLIIAINSITKLFVGDIVERARQVAALQGHTGPLLPSQLRQAHQLLDAEGKLPHRATPKRMRLK